jgi:hypothetical protein
MSNYWDEEQSAPDDLNYWANLAEPSQISWEEDEAPTDFNYWNDRAMGDVDPNMSYDSFGNPVPKGSPAAMNADPSGLAEEYLKMNSQSSGSGIKNLLNKLTRNSKGNLDWAKIAMLMYGAKTLADGKQPAPKMGFQGTIPKYQATSNLLTAPPGRRKPGAYGINYGGDPTYTRMAEGGLTNLARGRYLQGETDGMADQIPAQIGQDQPAALSHGEFVIPADVVSHLGNGNSDAGAKKLYSMMDKIRQARTGNKKQGKKINPDKFMPGGLAQAYANGGSVLKFQAGGAAPTSGEQTLSSWAGDYVTDMLGKGKALSEKPYEAYTGQLTAGPSDLQTKVSQGLNTVNFPGTLGQSFSSTGAYQPPQMNMDAYKTQPIGTGPQPGGINALPESNGFGYGGGGGNATGLTGGSQPTTMVEAQSNQQPQGIASQYMNPYLKSVLDPQLAELRRQNDITNMGTNAKLTQAGAFGGGRQAIMNAENNRNLMQEMNKTVGQGYASAYDKAMGQFNTEQTQGQALAKMMADQGVIDRGMEAEQVAADKAQFEEARANPYKQIQFQQSLLDKLPIQTTNYNTVTPSMLETLSGNMTKMNELLSRLGLLETPPKP